MATSGSTDFTLNGDQLIKDALVDLTVVADEDTPTSAMMVRARRKLNLFLKFLQTQGLQLWKRKRVQVLVEKDKLRYTLGPTGNAYACLTDNITSTTVAAAAVSGAGIIVVASATGLTVGDYFAVVQADGTLHKTTINAISGTNITITNVTTAAIAAGAQVWAFTSLIPRPLRLLECRIEDSSGNSRPINIISEEEWERLGTRSVSSEIVQVFFKPTLINSELAVYNLASDITDELHLIVQSPIEDIDNSTDDFDVPIEWLLTIETGLAYFLGPSFGIKGQALSDIKSQFKETLKEVSDWDVEMVSIYIVPESSRNF